MGTPVDFPQSNNVWRGWDGTEDRAQVLDLPVYRDWNESISCWKLTWRERLAVLLTGRVWFHVLRDVHPPIYAGGNTPFHDRPTPSSH